MLVNLSVTKAANGYFLKYSLMISGKITYGCDVYSDPSALLDRIKELVSM